MKNLDSNSIGLIGENIAMNILNNISKEKFRIINEHYDLKGSKGTKIEVKTTTNPIVYKINLT